MRVYRFQHITLGVGPLCGTTSFNWQDWIADMSYPCEDAGFREYYFKQVGLQTADLHFFGYDCLDKLFGILLPEGDAALLKAGFELVEFEVSSDYCVLADGQVFFHRGKARMI